MSRNERGRKNGAKCILCCQLVENTKDFYRGICYNCQGLIHQRVTDKRNEWAISEIDKLNDKRDELREIRREIEHLEAASELVKLIRKIK